MITSTVVQRITLPENRRIICISDIHAHLDYLKKLLERINFSGDDILFIVGDLIERGTQNLDTIRYVMELHKSNNVHVVMGNVDAWMMECFQDDSSESLEQIFDELNRRNQIFGGSLFAEVSAELGLPLDTPEDILPIRTAFRDKLAKEYEYILSLPTIIDTQCYTFVHGGIPHHNLVELEKCNPEPFLKNDDFVAKGIAFEKYVIVGHWPSVNLSKTIADYTPKINAAQKIISIDGGCGVKQAGQLNALIIPHIHSQDFSFDFYDNLPTAVAVTPQTASKNSINIVYTDYAVRVLKRGDEFSYLEHCSSGYRLWGENSCIRDIDSEYTDCFDYTDYQLSVAAGDKLSIIKKTSRGYRVKKAGVEGWYCGTLLE